jgi:hypothetical protein
MSDIKSINIILDKKKGASPSPNVSFEQKKKIEDNDVDEEDTEYYKEIFKSKKETKEENKRIENTKEENKLSLKPEQNQTIEYIKKNLMNYKECNIDQTPLGTYLKFITIRKNKESFNMGGILKKVYPEYCVFVKGSFLFRVTKNFYNQNGDLIYKSRFFINESQPNNVINAGKVEKLDSDGNYIYDENNLQDAIKRMEERKLQKKQQQIIEKQKNEIEIQKRSIDLLKRQLKKISKEVIS